jgi:imidazolonepropionase-like amidohydrolase
MAGATFHVGREDAVGQATCSRDGRRTLPRLGCLLAAGLVLSAGNPAPALGQSGSTIAIVGATVWDGTGSPPIPAATVLIRGGRIACVGAPERCPVDDGARIVDARGKFLLPGLIDTHVHLLLRTRGVTDPSIGSDLHDLLARGVTTVRDMGTNPARLREAVDAAQPAPRVFAMQLVAGYTFFSPEVERSPSGAVTHAPAALGMTQLGWSPILFVRTGRATEIVRQAKQAGAIGLKLYQGLDASQVAALSATAHAAGMSVWGHGWVQPASALEQARAGQDGVVHAAGLVGELVGRSTRDTLRSSSTLLQVTADSATARAAGRAAVLAALDSFVARGTFLEPTLRASQLSALRARSSPRRLETLPGRYAVAASEFGFRVTRLAASRGVRITAGTDHVAFGPADERVHLAEELELLVDSAGLTPARALLAATRDAALAIGTPARDLGTIERGKFADLVLLSASPLEDISNVRRVEWVITGGILFEPAALRKLGY